MHPIKYLKSLVLVFVIGFISASTTRQVLAQAGYTAVPFIEIDLDVRMQSLGNSFISFYGKEGALEINPASIGNHKDLRFSFTKREWQFYSQDPFKIYQFGLQTGLGKWGLAYQSRYFDYSDDSFRSGNESEFYHNFSASFNNQKGLSVGFGLNYIKSDLGETTSVSGNQELVANPFSADLGLQYRKQIKSEGAWQFTPSIGSSITDFGELVKYSGQEQGDPLPMRFRTGLGLTANYDKYWNDFKLFKGNVAFGISKFLVAIEEQENGDYKRFGPFQTLIKSWGSFKVVDPNTGNSKSYNLGEQFIFHSGLELTFLESISIRFGYQNGQKLNSYYSIKSVGFGIDLYYLSIDYVNSQQFDDDYEGHDNPINGGKIQLTGRIPLDGKSPKSLLKLFFD